MVIRVVLAVFLVSVTVILVALSLQTFISRPLPKGRAFGPMEQFVPIVAPATVRGYGERATSPEKIPSFWLAHAAARVSKPAGPLGNREARRRGRDPLRNHRATVGRDAKTPWYVPIRSFVLLLLLVIGLGMAIAGVTLAIIASGRFVLEILAG